MTSMKIRWNVHEFALSLACILNRRSHIMKTLSVLLPVIVSLAFSSPAFCLTKSIKIGVLAYRGQDEAMKMWSPTAAYLSAHVPNHIFSIVPLGFREFGPAVSDGLVDFVIANTSIYVDLETRYGISRIATLKNKGRHGSFTVFGGVIFCRADRNDIREIADLKGRSFMAVDENSLGGWHAAWKELKDQGIDPHRDFKALQFGNTHDAVVYAVLNGKVDAGTVRTDTLENMAADGSIDLKDFRILHEQRIGGFPFALSTRLYPEWPFARLRHTDDDLAQNVVIALLRIPPDSPAAKAAKITGWTVPLDYEPVHDLLKGLRLGPYKDYGKVTLSAAIRQYWYWVALVLLTVLFMAATTLYVFVLNRRLALSRLRLEEARKDLEQQVQDRTAKLSESEERYRMIVDTALEGIVTIDLQGTIVLANGRMAEMLGRTREEILGRSILSFVHEHEVQDHEKQLSMRQRGKASHYERRFRKKDGSVIWTSATATPLFNQDGTVRGSSGLYTDITERKRSEEALSRSEELMRSVLDSVDEELIMVDRDFRILLANRAYCSQARASLESVIGEHCYEVSHKIKQPCYEAGEECAVDRAFETGEPQTAYHKHPDAAENMHYVEIKAFPLKDASGNVISAIESINDITERYLLEVERIKTHKLEAIGTLAGGIAHDFNNLLQGVFGYVSLAKLAAGNREKSVSALEQAEKALHLSVKLSNQLLTFSKGGKPVKQTLDLRPVIENAAKFALSGARSAYRLAADDDLWMTDADEGQIGQVIQNMVLNADQAMPDGGMVEIRAKNVHAPDRDLSKGLQQGRHIEIAIQDHGCGIPEPMLIRIFDPYFTTKEKGSGLGLATSYSIVKNHNGLIDVQSEVGKGTTFFLYLPAASQERMAEPVLTEVVKASPRTARVLLMDDEQVIRIVTGDMLKELGHTVELAAHGAEAIEKYRSAMRSEKPFDAVILDLTIRSGMGGAETAEKLLEIDPEVMAIVSSGYSDDAVTAIYQEKGFKAILKKPYNLEELRAVLNALLQGRPEQ
jgi:two-component system, cell cycle sensor histidine kinase and response regulator CckA